MKNSFKIAHLKNIKLGGVNMTPYDLIGEMYNKSWGQLTLFQYPNIEELVLPSIPKNAVILDLCCGTGTIAGKLSEMGYKVYGIDIAKELLKHAKIKAPKAIFKAADIRDFSYDITFDAVISTLDSLNHILDNNDMRKVLENVFTVLKPGGILYFDIRNHEGYSKCWNGNQFNVIESQYVGALNFMYDSNNRNGLVKLAYFTENSNGLWKREDIYIPHKCYLEEEMTGLLGDVGFKNIQSIKKMEGVYADVMGRTHYICKKDSR